MPEPASNTAVVAAVVGTGLLGHITMLDGDTLMSAAAGASLFAVSAKELPIWKRVVYLLISLVIGYLGAPEVVHLTPINSNAAAAFVLAVLVVTVTLAVIERAKTFDLTLFFSKGGKP